MLPIYETKICNCDSQPLQAPIERELNLLWLTHFTSESRASGVVDYTYLGLPLVCLGILKVSRNLGLEASLDHILYH